MIAARGRPAAPATQATRAPIVTLLQELARRPAISDFSLVKDGESVVWRRA
jgi:hypothetical protein